MKTPQIPAQWSQHGQIEEVKPAAPANWYTSSTAEDLQGLIYNEKTGQNIAVCYNVEHAALIAAAPELLEACKAVMNCVIVNDNGKPVIEFHAHSDIAEAARAAIAKAEGN